MDELDKLEATSQQRLRWENGARAATAGFSMAAVIVTEKIINFSEAWQYAAKDGISIPIMAVAALAIGLAVNNLTRREDEKVLPKLKSRPVMFVLAAVAAVSAITGYYRGKAEIADDTEISALEIPEQTSSSVSGPAKSPVLQAS